MIKGFTVTSMCKSGRRVVQGERNSKKDRAKKRILERHWDDDKKQELMAPHRNFSSKQMPCKIQTKVSQRDTQPRVKW